MSGSDIGHFQIGVVIMKSNRTKLSFKSGECRANLSESTGSPRSVNFGAKNGEEFGFEGF